MTEQGNKGYMGKEKDRPRRHRFKEQGSYAISWF
jgi:hypothetical protein